jgi:hypothetical protein
MRITADVTGGKHIAALLQSISGVSATFDFDFEKKGFDLTINTKYLYPRSQIVKITQGPLKYSDTHVPAVT